MIISCIFGFVIKSIFAIAFDARLLEILVVLYLFNISMGLIVTVFLLSNMKDKRIELALVIIFSNLLFYSFANNIYRFLFKYKAEFFAWFLSIAMFLTMFGSLSVVGIVFFPSQVIFKYLSYISIMVILNVLWGIIVYRTLEE